MKYFIKLLLMLSLLLLFLGCNKKDEDSYENKKNKEISRIHEEVKNR